MVRPPPGAGCAPPGVVCDMLHCPAVVVVVAFQLSDMAPVLKPSVVMVVMAAWLDATMAREAMAAAYLLFFDFMLIILVCFWFHFLEAARRIGRLTAKILLAT